MYAQWVLSYGSKDEQRVGFQSRRALYLLAVRTNQVIYGMMSCLRHRIKYCRQHDCLYSTVHYVRMAMAAINYDASSKGVGEMERALTPPWHQSYFTRLVQRWLKLYAQPRSNVHFNTLCTSLGLLQYYLYDRLRRIVKAFVHFSNLN